MKQDASRLLVIDRQILGDRQYWLNRLSGLTGASRLSSVLTRGAAPGRRIVGRTTHADESTLRSLDRLTRGNPLLVYAAAVAALKVCMHRYTGDSTIAVVGHDPRDDNNGHLGAAAFVIVDRLLPTHSFKDVLSSVRTSLLDAIAHCSYPLERQLEDLAAESQGEPALEVEVSYQADGAEIRRSDYALHFTVFYGHTGLSYRVIFDEFQYDCATVERFCADVTAYLRSGLSCPEGVIGESFPADVETSPGSAGSPTSVHVPDQFVPVQQMVQNWAQRTPDAIALAGADVELSYRELDRLSTQIAEHLVQAGVSLECCVPVLAPRSPLMVAGWLGVLKTGAAFVPLDPNWPPRRVQEVVAKTHSTVVVADKELASANGIDSRRVVPLCSDTTAEACAVLPPNGATVSPANLAYVIYTSGSTGLPKGVAIEHAGLWNLVDWHQRTYSVHPGVRASQVASPAFDAAVWEVWPYLAGGASVHFPPAHVILHPPDLVQWFSEKGIKIVFLPTPLAELCVDTPWPPSTPVQYVLTGGDRLRRAPERRLPFQFVNHYGPTEYSVVTTFGEVLTNAATAPPIGKPISHTRVFVLNSAMYEVPAGVAGEAYIEGPGLARCYLDEQAFTAERFLPNPFGQPGSRLFRTGDYVRKLADGRLEFLGRMDRQVKVRGFRIETGEIETALTGHPSLLQAAVVAVPNQRGETQLSAYVVRSHSAGIDSWPADGGVDYAHFVESWRLLFDEQLYGDKDQPVVAASHESRPDDVFNTIGWRDTYTGDRIPEGAMREWASDVIARIKSLDPRRVLEIGCGTGMLLFPIAPTVRKYVGTDFSQYAIDYVQSKLPVAAGETQNVQLMLRTADNFEGIAHGEYDTVVLNSIVQYFPDAAYLLRVLRGAVETVGPAGRIFVGDVRSLPLLETFHASVQLHRANDDDRTADLVGHVRVSLRSDNELSIDPRFFFALRHQLPQIRHVQIFPERTQWQTEMSLFRYHTVLWVGEGPCVDPVESWQDWSKSGLTVDELRQQLRRDHPPVVAFSSIPNRRVQRATTALDIMRSPGAPQTAAGVKALLHDASEGRIDPSSLHLLASEEGYECETSWACHDERGLFEAVLRLPAGDVGPVQGFHEPELGGAGSDLYVRNSCTFDAPRLRPDLKRYLADSLPSYMIPEVVVELSALPQTNSGKVDYESLAAMGFDGSNSGKLRERPRTEIEERLTVVWSEVLNRHDVGVDQDFFQDLGGHSLLATQIVSRMRREFNVEMPVREIFEHPTVAMLAELITLQMERDSGRAADTIQPVSRDSRLPLSASQQRLWFLEQLYPERNAYNIVAAWRFSGPIDRDILQQALDHVVARHESLRTTFPSREGKPWQQIATAVSVPVSLTDLRHLNGDAEGAARRVVEQELHLRFDLSAGPLIRCGLASLPGGDTLLRIAVHHIIFDGWSLNLFASELSASYDAFTRGQKPELEPLPIQYADFAHWQNARLQMPEAIAQVDYWRQKLAGVQQLSLPTDSIRGELPSYQGATLRAEVPAGVVAQLRELANSTGTTLFMVLAAAFQALLYRYSGQEDVCIGVPHANRDQYEVEHLIGFFVNTLVLRALFSEDPSFAELLEKTRDSAMGAFSNHDVPFEKVVEVLHPDRDLRRSPLVQVLFALQNGEAAPLRLNGMTGCALDFDVTTTRFDLEFHLWEVAEGLKGILVYSTDLFSESLMKGFLHCFERLLSEIAADPARRVSEIPLMNPTEERCAIAVVNNTEPLASPGGCLHHQFEAQAAARGDAPALVDGDRVYSYAEVNRLANRVASRIRAEGMQIGARIGLCAVPSVEAVISMLGIIKAGGCLVPLQPTYPRQRLQFMIEDSGIELLVLGENVELPALRTGRCVKIDVDDPSASVFDVPLARLERPSSIDSAYIIYTSGSTGRPKGVVVHHGAVVNVLNDLKQRLGVTHDDRMLALAPLSFDISIAETFLPLMSGGVLEIVAVGAARDPQFLKKYLETGNTTIVQATPATWTMLLDSGWRGGRTVRILISTAEALSPTLSGKLFETGIEAWNLYGPTEAAIFATAERIRRQRTAVTIGSPIRNTTAYVLDRQLALVPQGVCGELYLGGNGVAQGYLNRPELTAERFIPDPFGGRGARMYRTGDLARYGSDGSIEYLGRTDHQIKIRGFRIEAAEVEAALERYPGVRRAVVISAEVSGAAVLCAYLERDVASTNGRAFVTGSLRGFLAEMLPDYMIPSTFIEVQQFPLTPSGKVDRASLPRPSLETSIGIGEQTSLPTTREEESLLMLWAELLGVDVSRIGIHDNFFELGGHSLLLPRLQASILNSLQIHIEIVTFFERPTIHLLAEHIRHPEKPGVDLSIARSLADARREAQEARELAHGNAQKIIQ